MNNVIHFPFENHILLLHKPSGSTSNNVIQQIKKSLGIKKIGHAGTLDKFAEGLLIVLLGKATKLSDILLNLDKEYLATLCFGAETDSLDTEGKVVATAPLPSTAVVESIIAKFTGELAQVPPQYSAIHIEGTRASILARKGIAIEMPTRRVTVYSQNITSMTLPSVEVEWHVSKGTYIRALARDIGRACQSNAHLSKLVRTKIANYTLAQSISLETLLAWREQSLQSGMRSIKSVVELLPDSIKVSTEDLSIRTHLVQGIQPSSLLALYKDKGRENGILYISDADGLVGIWKWSADKWKLVLAIGYGDLKN